MKNISYFNPCLHLFRSHSPICPESWKREKVSLTPRPAEPRLKSTPNCPRRRTQRSILLHLLTGGKNQSLKKACDPPNLWLNFIWVVTRCHESNLKQVLKIAQTILWFSPSGGGARAQADRSLPYGGPSGFGPSLRSHPFISRSQDSQHRLLTFRARNLPLRLNCS